ncbi:MAG: glycerol-3-phosphate acyltransferase [Anaerolineae bacterium]|nr:MAG: glycerol-3-phosphate acyltransferase [Anaerolineae bacterium]
MDLILAAGLGYLLGSFPTGVIVGRWLTGRDPRQHGSGHTGGLNIYRLGGMVPLLLTGAGDIGKGMLAVWLAERVWEAPWAVPLAGAAAVTGHCWSLWASFRGGMGVGTSAGAMLLLHPWTIPAAVAAFVVVRRVIPHSPRAMLATLVTLPTLQLALGAPWEARALGVLIAVVMFLRYAGDWGRVYE